MEVFQRREHSTSLSREDRKVPAYRVPVEAPTSAAMIPSLTALTARSALFNVRNVRCRVRLLFGYFTLRFPVAVDNSGRLGRALIYNGAMKRLSSLVTVSMNSGL